MIKLAIYDMDRTITRNGTYTPFLLYAARRLSPWRLLLAPIVPMVMLLYVAKFISRSRLKEWNQNLLLGPWLDPIRLKPVVDGYARHVLKSNIYREALERVAAEKADGWRTVLATASYRLYVEAIAAGIGMDNVIATDSVIDADGHILARIDGENCYGTAKLRMIEAWMVKQGIERKDAQIRFYSDHASDAPVLEWSDVPYAVNPHAKLKLLAETRGWQIIDWR